MSDAAPELSVIAPCFNEEGNVQPLVRRMMATFDEMGIDAELVLIDDGSRDDTWAKISQASESEPRVQGVKHEVNRGMVAGWRSGLAAARGRLVCLIDSDLQNRPEDVARLYEAYQREKPDIVQAVRQAKHNQGRVAFSRALNHILNITFGMRLRDNKSGFILCTRDALEKILEHRYNYRYFQSFVGAAAGVRGYRFAEVETDFDPRTAGESFLSNVPIGPSLRILVELVKYRVETWNIKR